MYHNHPELHLDEPRSLEELERITCSLPEHKRLMNLQSSYPPDSVFPETYFPENTDVIVNRHLRYSPCFFHSHDFFELSYVVSGQGLHYLSGEKIFLKKGDLSLMSLHTPHTISAFRDDTLIVNLMLRASTFHQTFFGILTGQDIISSFFSRALYTPDAHASLLFETGGDPVIRDLILRIMEESLSDREYKDQMATALITELFIHLLRNHSQSLSLSNSSGKRQDSTILVIITYMMKNCRDLTLGSLSSFFGYSERQMTRILQEYTGKNFTEILKQIRVEKACELLRNPHIPIPEVAETVGYSNPSHFYSVFREKLHMTPAVYRKEALEEKEVIP